MTVLEPGGKVAGVVVAGEGDGRAGAVGAAVSKGAGVVGRGEV